MSNNAPDYENNLAFDLDINTMPRCDIEALKSEIKKLKELLKESYKMLAQYHVENSEPSFDENIELLTKIDNAIGENN
jgi:hypothetical protein|nr:MAG TPA: hypothetical protein [Caudoviricetes sp.]